MLDTAKKIMEIEKDYSELYPLNRYETVHLVKNPETGELFVKKLLKIYDMSVYEYLYSKRPSGIPIIYSMEKTPDGLMIIEEFISGKTLQTILAEQGPFSEQEAFVILTQICHILSPLHQNNPPIVHRDIKPSNIMLTKSGEVYLLDFNAATHYQESKDRDTVLIGTTGYAAPEQYGFKASDPRADVYALGCVAQELLTGERSSPNSYSGPFSYVIRKSMEMDPKNRFPNAELLAEAFESEQSTLKGWLKKIKRIVSENRAVHAQSWLPPGFRTHNPIKSIIALAYYLFWIVGVLLIVPDYTLRENINNFFIVFVFMVYTFILCNYRDMWGKLPWARSTNRRVKVFGFVFWIIIFSLILLLSYPIFNILLPDFS